MNQLRRTICSFHRRPNGSKNTRSAGRSREMMPVNSAGIVTARDSLSICWDKFQVEPRVRKFAALPVETARAEFALGSDARDWKVYLAQEDINNTGFDTAKIKRILYRPFDRRWTYFTGTSRGFLCMPRPEVMAHMIAGGRFRNDSHEANARQLGCLFRRRCSLPINLLLLMTSILPFLFTSTRMANCRMKTCSRTTTVVART